MATVEHDLPRMAEALIPTGLTARSLGKFVGQMFGMHMRYVESSLKLRIFNEDKNLFRAKYKKSWKKDEQTGAISYVTPKLQGIPFTADNFIRAAGLTYPRNEHGVRIVVSEKPNHPNGNTHSGIPELERELIAQHYGTTAGPGQQTFDFGAPPREAPLMRPPDAATVASHDYYYDELVKMGVIKEAQAEAVPAQATAVPTAASERARITMGELTDDDTIRGDNWIMLPVPDLRRLNLKD